jgi:hypothetical protein
MRYLLFDIGMALVTIGLAIAIVVLLNAHAPAAEQQPQRRFYDSRGNSVGTASTDSQGTTTFRDARGNVTGKSTKR